MGPVILQQGRKEGFPGFGPTTDGTNIDEASKTGFPDPSGLGTRLSLQISSNGNTQAEKSVGFFHLAP